MIGSIRFLPRDFRYRNPTAFRKSQIHPSALDHPFVVLETVGAEGEITRGCIITSKYSVYELAYHPIPIQYSTEPGDQRLENDSRIAIVRLTSTATYNGLQGGTSQQGLPIDITEQIETENSTPFPKQSYVCVHRVYEVPSRNLIDWWYESRNRSRDLRVTPESIETILRNVRWDVMWLNWQMDLLNQNPVSKTAVTSTPGDLLPAPPPPPSPALITASTVTVQSIKTDMALESASTKIPVRLNTPTESPSKTANGEASNTAARNDQTSVVAAETSGNSHFNDNVNAQSEIPGLSKPKRQKQKRRKFTKWAWWEA